MTRVDITLGLLAILGAIMIAALVGFGEEERMSKASVGYNKRSVETGAQLFNQYCAACHGPNASGLNCPPLNELSGLHGGDLGPGVAWRLEEQHWDRGDVYGYVSAAISAGRMASTRPDRYRGTSPDAMQMPAWSQNYGGPLRPDQIKDLTNYIVNFREYFPAADEEDAYKKACQQVIDNMQKPGAPVPSVAGYENACAEELGVELDIAAAAPTAEASSGGTAADTTGTPGTPIAGETGTPGAGGTGTPAADGTAAATGSPAAATAPPAALATPTGAGG